MKKDEEFLKRLRATFQIEAEDLLKALSSSLLELEKKPEAEESLESAFRSAHSLKGASRAVNIQEIETLCQTMEDLFARWRKREIAPTPGVFDLLHRALETVQQILTSPEAPWEEVNTRLAEFIQGAPLKPSLPQSPEPASEENPPQEDSSEKASEVFAENSSSAPSPSRGGESGLVEGLPKISPFSGTLNSQMVRVSVEKLDSLFLQAEEMISFKLSFGRNCQTLREMVQQMDLWKKDWDKTWPLMKKNLLSKKEEPEKTSTKVLEFLEENQREIQGWQKKMHHFYNQMEEKTRLLGGKVDHLLEEAKKILMLPFSTILEPFPRMVRELCRHFDKEVNLVIQGSEVALDKRILEELKSPLLHLIRNSLDHGIERREERQKKGKPPQGTLEISIAQNLSNQVEVLVRDDGRGIDREGVKKSAVKKGIFTEEEVQALSEWEVVNLIFQSEISTAPLITDISGRGLGLAILQEGVERLGGALFVETSSHQGTLFRISLPLTLATLRGILVEAAGQVFAIPLSQVEKILRVRPDEMKTLENRPAILWKDQVVSAASLGGILSLSEGPEKREEKDFLLFTLLQGGGKMIAFEVDEVLGEQEILVKNLGSQLSRVPGILGATLLGSLKAIPILNVLDLIKIAGREDFSSPFTTIEESQSRQKSLLVVEDSITSRILLKNILEGAGYAVQTAVDGSEAFGKLGAQPFDLVVSDIEMPRMNGFELTRKIREDKNLSHMPVVLVTSLQSSEDRERGIDAGADAYIVKSSFDQNNLLEVLQRLI